MLENMLVVCERLRKINFDKLKLQFIWVKLYSIILIFFCNILKTFCKKTYFLGI
jgi:hypothetical protein